MYFVDSAFILYFVDSAFILLDTVLDSNMIINKIHIPFEFHDEGRWTLLGVLHEVITEVSLFHFLDILMILTKKVKIATTRLLGRVVKFSE